MKNWNRTPASIAKWKAVNESCPSFGITEWSVAAARRKSRTNQNASDDDQKITNVNESIESIESIGLTVTRSINPYIDEIEKNWLDASGQAKIKHQFEINGNHSASLICNFPLWIFRRRHFIIKFSHDAVEMNLESRKKGALSLSLYLFFSLRRVSANMWVCKSVTFSCARRKKPTIIFFESQS